MKQSETIRKYLFLALFFSCTYTQAQESKVQKFFEEMRLPETAKTKSPDEAILFKPGNEAYVLKHIEASLSDSSASMRMRGIALLSRVAYKSSDSAFRQKAVKKLLTFFRDNDPNVTSRAARYITGFKYQDLSDNAKDEIRLLIGSNCNHYDWLLKIAGFAQLKDKAGEIKAQLLEGTLTPIMKWASILTLARMGEPEYIALCLLTARDIPVDDNMMYNTLPDLIYTKQKETFDYLIEILMSNNENCHSPNPNYSGKILCAYRVMEALASVIEDFPVKVKQSGDLVTDNYEKSLEITRKWMTEHKTNYNILTYTF